MCSTISCNQNLYIVEAWKISNGHSVCVWEVDRSAAARVFAPVDVPPSSSPPFPVHQWFNLSLKNLLSSSLLL